MPYTVIYTGINLLKIICLVNSVVPIQRLTSIAITVSRWCIFTLQQQKSRFSSSVAIVTNDIDLFKKDYKTEVQNCTLLRQKKLVNGP